MYSVGIDMVEIGRIKKCAESRHFVERVFSDEEQTLFASKKDPYESMAGNWAAKEAFSKALGTGVRGFALSEVSVLRNELGAPYLKLSGKAKDIAEKSGLRFSISITHTAEYAQAICIGYSGKEE